MLKKVQLLGTRITQILIKIHNTYLTKHRFEAFMDANLTKKRNYLQDTLIYQSNQISYTHTVKDLYFFQHFLC